MPLHRSVRIGSTLGFELGATRPDASNTGVTGAARSAYTDATGVAGSSDPAIPVVIPAKDVSDRLVISSGYVRFEDCLFTSGGTETTDTGQVDCRGPDVLGVTFDRCTFRPDTPTYWLNAVIGHHMTVNRCDISRVVDAIGSYNTTGPRTDNVITGNYVHDLCRFEVDQTHSDGTHNDSIQHQGGLGLRVIGNNFAGRQYHVDGSTPSGQWACVQQAVLVQENVAIGGVYYCGEIVIRDNWIGEHATGVRLYTRALASSSPYDATVTGNRFGTMYDWGSGSYYPVRVTNDLTMNGVLYDPTATPATAPAADTNGNIWEASSTAVLVRSDAM